MRPTLPAHSLCVGASLLAMAVSAWAQDEKDMLIEKLERENRQLRLELTKLKEGYQTALEQVEDRTRNLSEVKKQMALFGKEFFAGGDDRLRLAVADYQVSREKLQSLEATTLGLVSSVQEYLRTAVTADPEARAEVEIHIRSVEAALGYRQKPAREIERGTPQSARIVSIDSESGVAVINAGDQAQVRPGMKFQIERAGARLADATVAVTRPEVSGLFINTLLDNNNPVRPGDIASIIIEQSQP